ncbi:GNAT family N-acetyltransferase, partial [Pseudomonas sp. FSL A6-1183]|uniref:GNAT family N-acetyltransferase n=1 Tax=unclassified Pseudomonas TaxID=196821 RepID=UPI001C49B737
HLGLLALMAVYFTENRISWVYVQSLENEARKEGCFHLMLETGYRQLEAISFYERNGYQRRGPFGGYEYDPNSIFLEKHLES